MKKCNKCNKTYTLDNFHKNRQSKDGLRHICKHCQSKKDRKITYQEIVAFDYYE